MNAYSLRRVDLRVITAFLKNLRNLGDETERQIVRLMMNHWYVSHSLRESMRGF